jgi:hypothetical protein
VKVSVRPWKADHVVTSCGSGRVILVCHRKAPMRVLKQA